MRTIQGVRQQKRHLGKKVKDGHIFAKYGEFNITQESTRLIRFVPPLDGTILHFLSQIVHKSILSICKAKRKRKRVCTIKAHTLFVSNPCPATAIVFVSQHLFYGQLPESLYFL
jgi:hypothetical protein